MKTRVSREFLICLGIFLVAAAIRIFYLFDYSRTAVFPVVEYSDGHYYSLWARDIAAGDLLGTRVFMKWPLYAYFLGGLSRISGDDLFFVYCVQIIMSACTCMLIYLLGKRLFSRAAGLASVGLYLWYAMPAFFDTLPLYTSLALFLNVLFCYVLTRSRDTLDGNRVFAIGLLGGLCALSQGNSIFFCLPAALLVIFAGPNVTRRKVNLFAGFLAGFVLLIGVVTARNFAVSGDLVPMAGNMGINFYIGNNPDADGLFYSPPDISANQEGMFRDAKAIARFETKRFLSPSQVSAYWFRKGMAFIRANPRTYALLLWKKFCLVFSLKEPLHDLEFPMVLHNIRALRLLIPDLSLILPFGLLGMIMSVRRFKEIGVLYIGVASFSLSLLAFFVTTRYRILYVPFMSLFAGAGIVSIVESARKQMYRVCCAQYLLIITAFFALNFVPKESPARRIFVTVPLVQEQVDKALAAMKQGRIEQALAHAAEARRLQPEHYIGSLMKGYVLYKSGNSARAEESLNMTVHEYPHCVYAHHYLAELYNGKEEFAKAERALRRALFLDDDYALSYYELGKAYKGALRLDKANNAFVTALRKNGHSNSKLRALILEELKNL